MTREMDQLRQQVRDLTLLLRAVVLSKGGKIIISDNDMADAPGGVMSIYEEPSRGGKVLEVKR